MEQLLEKSIREALEDVDGCVQDAIDDLIAKARKRKALYDAFVGDPLPTAVDAAVRDFVRRDRNEFRNEPFNQERQNAIGKRMSRGRINSLYYYPLPFSGIFLGEATEADLDLSISKSQMQVNSMVTDISWFRLIRPKLNGRKVKDALSLKALAGLKTQAEQAAYPYQQAAE